MKCPLCRQIDVGKVGTGQYYCWHCLVEFTLNGRNEFAAYYVDEEGTLIDLQEMAQNSQLVEETILG